MRGDTRLATEGEQDALVMAAWRCTVFATPLNDDEVLVDERRRSAVPVALMTRPGARQFVVRTKLVDSARFSVRARAQ